MESKKVVVIFEQSDELKILNDYNSLNYKDDSIVRSAKEYLNDLDCYLEMNEICSSPDLNSKCNFNNNLVHSQSLKQLHNCFNRIDLKRQTISEFHPIKPTNFDIRKIRKYPVSINMNHLACYQNPEKYREKYLQYCTIRKKSHKTHFRTNSAPNIINFQSEQTPIVIVSQNDNNTLLEDSNLRLGQNEADNRISLSTSSFNCNRINDLVNEDTVHIENEAQTQNEQNQRCYENVSSMFTTLGCTIGLFNISRFAIKSVHLGSVFLLQFFIMSCILGIPMFTLQQALGQKLKKNMVNMWFITPLFQGIGISLLLVQSIIGIYTVVGLSWMFVYFRDAFNAIHEKNYEWSRFFTYEFKDGNRIIVNNSIIESIPNYWNYVVLQRQNYDYTNNKDFGNIKFHSAFNLAVVWMIIFVALSKGIKSYKISFYNFMIMALAFFLMFFIKILSLVINYVPYIIITDIYWSDFFRNKNWIVASQEALLTWCLLSPAVMQISAQNKQKKHLKRNLKFVIVMTNLILFISALLAQCCIQILYSNGFSYHASSYEKLNRIQFLSRIKNGLPKNLSNVPTKNLKHNIFIVGEEIKRFDFDKTIDSGYQVLRLATELVPAAISLIGFENISCYWTITFYLSLIFFGIAQQLVIWNCVITGITAINLNTLKDWEVSITFFSCVFGFLLGLPFTSDLGIRLMYLFDYIIGGSWWLMMILFIYVIVLFLIRGRPYTGDSLIKEFLKSSSPNNYSTTLFSTFLTFAWSIILPIILMVLCIAQFKHGAFRELYRWNNKPNYWSINERKFGSLVQISLILCVPFIALIQCYRYLKNGPTDILERIQMLYRPRLDNEEIVNRVYNNNSDTHPHHTETDLPPKYSPPPSYTTATGVQFAKMIRRSFRRTLRRVNNFMMGESSRAVTISEVSEPNQQIRDQISQNSVTATVVEVACSLRNSFRSILPNSNANQSSVSVENLILS